eukprot:INCI16398.11.p1 GENE.INCI16398.11~~INCI16398.11.p1  ORF type:complete len:1041 (-),score=261.10 INCI16398.11:926-4048(-)
MDFTTMPDFASALDKLRRERAHKAGGVGGSLADSDTGGFSLNEVRNNLEPRELARKDTATVMSAATSTPIPAFSPAPTSTSTSTSGSNPSSSSSSSRASSLSAAVLFGGRGVQAVADTLDEEEPDPQVVQPDDEEFPSLEKAFNAKPEVAALASPVQTAQSLFASRPAEATPAPATLESTSSLSAYTTPAAGRAPEAYGDKLMTRKKPPTPSNIVDARPVDTVAALAKKTAALSVVAAFQDSNPGGSTNFLKVNARLQQQLDTSEAAIAAAPIRVADDGESDEEPLDLWSASSSDDDTLDGGVEAESVGLKRPFPPQSADLRMISTSSDERQVEVSSSPRVPPLDKATAMTVSMFSGSVSPTTEETNNSDERDERANLSSPDLPSEITSPKLSLKSASTILMQRAKTKLMSELRAAKQLALQSSEEFRAQTQAVLKNAGEMHRMLQNLTLEKDEAEAQLARVQKSYDQLKEENDQLRVEQRKFERAAERHEATSKALAASKAKEAHWLQREEGMEKELSELKESYKWTETFQDDYEAMKEAAAVMKEKATASIREIEELRQQLKEARANSAQVQEDGAELAWLKSEVEQQRLTIQTLKDENDSLRKSEFNALQKVDSVTSLLNHSPGPSPIPFTPNNSSMGSPPQLTSGGSPFAALDKLHEVRGQQQSGVRSVTALVEKLKQRTRAAETGLADANKLIDEKDKMVKSLTSAQKRLRRQVDELQGSLERERTEAARASEEALSRQEALENQIGTLRRQVHQLKGTSSGLREENQQLSDSIGSVKAALRREHQAAADAAARAKAIQSEMTSQREAAAQAIRRLQDSIAEEQASCAASKAEIEALRTRLAKAEDERARLSHDKAHAATGFQERQVELEERLAKNVAQVSELETRLHGVQRQLHEVEGDRKSLEAQARHHEERYRTARASLSRAEESVAALSSEMVSARDQISQLEFKEASQAAAISGLERDLSTAQAQRKALENEKAHLVQENSAKLDECARNAQSLRQQLDDQAEVLRGARQAADIRTRDAEDRHKKQLDVV